MQKLDKKKYGAAEVEKLLTENSADYKEELFKQRDRINALVEENRKLLGELEHFKLKEDSIVRALVESENKAKEITDKSETEYALTVLSLKKFASRWEGYFGELKDKYPLYSAVTQAIKLKEKLSELLKTGNNKLVVETLSEKIDRAPKPAPFDPKSKMDDYIAATSDNGFNLEEVLNPGELHLEDLCKELGLMESEEQ